MVTEASNQHFVNISLQLYATISHKYALTNFLTPVWALLCDGPKHHPMIVISIFIAKTTRYHQVPPTNNLRSVLVSPVLANNIIAIGFGQHGCSDALTTLQERWLVIVTACVKSDLWIWPVRIPPSSQNVYDVPGYPHCHNRACGCLLMRASLKNLARPW